MKICKKIIAAVLCFVLIVGMAVVMPITASAANVSNSTGSDKINMLSDNLFHNATYYNNDLAVVSANLLCDVEDVSAYFPKDHSDQYTWGKLGQAFHVGIGYKEIEINGTKKNLVAITFRGTGSLGEAILDFLKDFDHNPYEDQQALMGPWDFAVSAESYLNQFFDKFSDVKKLPIVYLVSGYSLGGAAANLLGARLTKRNGGQCSDNVFVYTFGAIKAIASETNVKENYGNIHNIYNYYDSWGPNGNHSLYGVSDPYYKFGNTHFCYFDRDHAAVGLNSHDMGNYRTEVELKKVEVSINRKAGGLNGGQWWTISKRNLTIDTWNYLYIYGSGTLSDGSLMGMNYPWYGYVDSINMIVIDDNITEIGEFEFNKADKFSNLYTIHIPVSVTSIGDCAFGGCDSLEDIYYSGTREQWNAINVDYSIGNYPLQNATLHCIDDEPLSTDNIDQNRVVIESGSCGPNLMYVLYTDGILEITGSGEMTSHPWTKKCVDRIGEVHFPEGLTSLCYGAFRNCINLTEFNTTNNLVKIGQNAFDNTAWYKNQPDGIIYVGHVAYGIKGDTPTNITLDSETRGIADYAFYYNEDITNVIFNSNLIYIGKSAFEYCDGLTEINISDSVKTIGESAFAVCDNLKNVVIGRGVEEIDEYAFAYSAIENFYVLSKNIKKLGTDDTGFIDILGGRYYTYNNAPNLTIYAIESKLSYDFTFIAEAYNLNCIIFDLKNNKAAVSLHLYGDCESYALPEKILDYPVTSIKEIDQDISYMIENGEKKDFSITNSIKNITIPKTVTEDYTWEYDYGDGRVHTDSIALREILRDCILLENIFVSEDNPKYSSVDGVLYDKNVNELLVCPMQKKVVNVPDTVNKITGEAFATSYLSERISEFPSEYNITNTHTLCFGNGFGKDANNIVFWNCKTVDEIYISDAFVSDAFTSNTYFPDGVAIDMDNDGIMKSFPDLKCIHANDDSQKFADYDGVLYDKSLSTLIAVPTQKTELNIPATVTNLSKLRNRYIEHYYYTDNKYKHYDNFCVASDNPIFKAVDGVIFNRDMTELIIYPAGKCADEYTVPDTVSKIAPYAFINCENLKKIRISDSVIDLGYKLGFYSVSRNGKDIIDDFTILGYSKSVAQKYAYENGIKFESLGVSKTQNVEFEYNELDDGTLELIQYNYIGNEFSIPSEIQGKKVSEIYNIFRYCYNEEQENVTNILLPDSIKNIDSNSFSGCFNLKTVEFSSKSKLEIIGDSAFADCGNLEEVVLGNAISEIASDAFYNCKGLKSISIPKSIQYIGYRAFGYYEESSDENYVTDGIEKKVEGFTIYGYSGTEAERYANENGFIFIALKTPYDSEPDTDPSSSETQPTKPTTPAKTTVIAKAVKSTISIDNTTTVKPTVKNGKGKTIFTTSNKAVATVSSKGVVKGLKAGKVTITVKNNGESAKVKITITKKANPMKITAKKTVSANSKKKTTIKKAVVVKKAQGKITYKTNNKKVTVKNGTMTVAKGLKKGKTYAVKVTVKAAGNKNYKSAGKTVKIMVKVK